MEAKHTPGPWLLDGDFSGVCRVEFEGSGSYMTISSKSRVGAPVAFAIGTPDVYWGDDEECEANARLIAAAPELLEACQYIVAAGESGDEALAIEKATAAVNKATKT